MKKLLSRLTKLLPLLLIIFSTNISATEKEKKPLPPHPGTISGPTVICIGETADLVLTGYNAGSTFQWESSRFPFTLYTPIAGATSDSYTTPPLYSTADKTYFRVKVLYNGQLSATQSHHITFAAGSPPTTSVSPSAPTICNGDNVTLTASGAYTYAWSPGGSLSDSTIYNPVASPTTTTTYTVVGTHYSNGCTKSATVTVTVGNGGTVSVIPTSANLCNGDSVQLTASDYNTYSWLPTTGLNSSNIATPIAYPSTTTTYTVTGTSTGGCTGTSSVTITVNPNPIAGTASVSQDTVAEGDTIVFSLTGYLGNIQWQSSDTSTGNFSNIVGANLSNYTVVMTGSSNIVYRAVVYNTYCDSVFSNIIEILPPNRYNPNKGCITDNCAVPNDPCNLVCNGSFELTSGFPWAQSQIAKLCGWGSATAGSPDYFHVNGVGDANIPNTYRGYQQARTGSAMAGFDASYIQFLTGNRIHEYIYQQLRSPLIAGESYQISFYVAISPTPAYAAYSNDISALLTTYNSITTVNSTPGFYGIFPGTPAQTFAVTNTGWQQVTFSYTATGGEDVIVIGNFSNTTNPSNSPNNSYYYLDDVSLIQTSNNLTVNANPNPVICGSNTTLTASPTNYPINSPSNFVSWAPSTNITCATCPQTSATPTSTTTYTVTINDPIGCSKTATALVTYGPNLPITATAAPSTICEGESTNLSASGATTYSWIANPTSSPPALNNPNISNPIFTPTSPGTYTVTVTGVTRGCTGTASIVINVLSGPNLTVSPTSTSICNGHTAILTASGAVSYNWAPANGLGSTNTATVFASPTTNTTYTVTGTAANGCTKTKTVTVSIITPPVPIIEGNPSSCLGAAGLNDTYTITNFNGTTSDYTITVTNGTLITSLQSNGTFVVAWNTGPGLITVTFNDPVSGCPATTIFEIFPCCDMGPPTTYYNHNATATADFIPGLGNTPTGQCFSFNGTFEVNTNLTWDNCIVKLGGNAKINIQNGATLTIQNNSHLLACSEMWDRIQIQPGGVLIVSNSLIEDAKTAIYSIGGGAYTLNGAHLNRNFQHMELTTYGSPHTGSIVNSNFTCGIVQSPSTATCTTLPPATNAFLNYPYNSVPTITNIGIKVQNVQSLTIGNPTSGNTNTFDNIHGYGIITDQSSVDIYNNDFSNIIIGSPGAGEFVAIKATNNSSQVFPPARTVNIGNGTALGSNTFDNCYQGIIMENGMNSTIDNNSFSNIQLKGIFLNRNTKNNTALVTNNDFTTTTLGIHGYQNRRCITTITYNTMDNMNFSSAGIFMQEINRVNAASRYLVKYNTIKTVSRWGVRGENLRKADIDNNVIELASTPFSFPNTGVDIIGNLESEVTDNTIKAIPAVTLTNFGGVHAALSTSSNIECNNTSDMGYSIQCEGPMPSRIYNNTMTNTTNGIWLNNGGIVGQQGNATSPSYNTWVGTFTNQSYASGNPFTNGAFSPFYELAPLPTLNGAQPFNPQSFPIPFNIATSPFIAVCNTFVPKNVDLFEDIVQDSIPFSSDSIKWIAKRAIYSEVMEGDSLLLTSSILTNFRDSAMYASMGLLDTVNLQVGNESLINDSVLLANAFATNYMVSPTLPAEDDTKKINKILLDYIERNDLIFNDIELDTLRSIANKCPFICGVAVYEARVLLQPYDTLFTVYQNTCEVDQSPPHMYQPIQKEEKLASSFNLYPNPNNGTMTLNYSINEMDRGYLVIYDISGRIVGEFNLETNKNTMNITQNNLKGGLYIYSILINNQIVKTDRLIIIK